MSYSVIHGEAIAEMRKMPDASFDAVITDPPYFAKLSNAWDNQWSSREDFMAWIEQLCVEWRRLLKPNGSLYVFASPENASGVEEVMRRHFNVLTHVVWNKDARTGNRTSKEGLRSFFPNSERIIFAEQRGSDSFASGEKQWSQKSEDLRGFVFEPIRAYLDGERVSAGIDKADCNAACGFKRTAGGMASRHYFSRSQWALPTEAHYSSLQSLFQASDPSALNRTYEELRAEYEELRAEYEELRAEYEDLRRPFFLTSDVQWGDVWSFPSTPSRRGRHTCEKPIELMSHIVNVSTRRGDVVLDCFGGSGSTGVACIRSGRSPVLIELDSEWISKSTERLSLEFGGVSPELYNIAAE